MSKHTFIDISTVANTGVEIKRWWRSTEVWNQLVGLVGTLLAVIAGIAPSVLPLLPTIGLSPVQLFAAVIMFNGVIQVNGIILKMRSTSVIGTKTDVEIAKDAVAPEPAYETGERHE